MRCIFFKYVGAGLQGEMDELTQRGEVAEGFHELEGDVDRVRGHESDSGKAGDFIETVEKVVEKAVPFRFILSIAVDVLS